MSGILPSSEYHCDPCPFGELPKLSKPLESTSSLMVSIEQGAVQTYALFADSPRRIEFANQMLHEEIGLQSVRDRFQAAEGCAAIVCRGECPDFRVVDGSRGERFIVTRPKIVE